MIQKEHEELVMKRFTDIKENVLMKVNPEYYKDLRMLTLSSPMNYDPHTCYVFEIQQDFGKITGPEFLIGIKISMIVEQNKEGDIPSLFKNRVTLVCDINHPYYDKIRREYTLDIVDDKDKEVAIEFLTNLRDELIGSNLEQRIFEEYKLTKYNEPNEPMEQIGTKTHKKISKSFLEMMDKMVKTPFLAFTRKIRWNNDKTNYHCWIRFEGSKIIFNNTGMNVGGGEYRFDYKDMIADDWEVYTGPQDWRNHEK